MERLQKILAQAGIASRREAEKIILAGRVTVDGEVIDSLGYKTELEGHTILVDGNPIKRKEALVYYMLNKPKGYISTVKDDRGRKTVIDLFPEVKERIFPIGRLDGNTEGLLLFTNDGSLMNGLLHPKYEVYKTYVALVEGIPTDKEILMLKNGIELSDGMTAPAGVRILFRDIPNNRTKLEIMIHEGRNRQVRRMCEAAGHPVHSLKRTEFAGLNLSGLKRGMHRPLTEEEIRSLYELSGAEEKK